ncbi:hypothetical protein [Streptomyces sp. NPDC091299]|uniref:hypothetical protein n=1 Tax=Streptomyces sp. NPDC091299 TaxID=3155302 RepID=UPI003422377D
MTDQTAASPKLRTRLAEAVQSGPTWTLPRSLAEEITDAALAVVRPELDRLDRIRDAARLHRRRLISTSELYAVIEAMDAPAATEAAEPDARQQAEAWRRKAVRRALKISKLQGTLAAVTDLASEQITARTEWGDGYRAALADLQEVLREFEPPAPDAGPTVAQAAADDRLWPLQKHGE